MNCEQVRAMLVGFVHGTVSGEESRAVRLHLASCAGCASRLSPSDRIEILPALDETVEPSGDFTARFQEKLRHRQTLKASRIPARKNGFRSRWLLVLSEAGAAVAILVLGIFLFRGSESTTNSTDGLSDLEVAENLHLLQDMAVISNLDLLENFDAIEKMTPAADGMKVQRSNP